MDHVAKRTQCNSVLDIGVCENLFENTKYEYLVTVIAVHIALIS